MGVLIFKRYKKKNLEVLHLIEAGKYFSQDIVRTYSTHKSTTTTTHTHTLLLPVKNTFNKLISFVSPTQVAPVPTKNETRENLNSVINKNINTCTHANDNG